MIALDRRPLTEGERWVRDALEALRADHFSPPAVARFVVASERRARETRAARPDVVRQARVWSLAGALVWLVGAAIGSQVLRRRLPVGLAWWGMTAFMLDRHLGMFETERGEPRPLRAADALTLARAWTVPLVADRVTPFVCAAALASDALDGRIARGSATTRAGRDFDPIVDAAFAAAALRGAARHSRLTRLAIAAEGLRIGAAVGVVGGHYFRSGGPPVWVYGPAARRAAPVRAAGLIAASLGHRRSGSTLITAGALVAAAAAVSARRP